MHTPPLKHDVESAAATTLLLRESEYTQRLPLASPRRQETELSKTSAFNSPNVRSASRLVVHLKDVPETILVPAKYLAGGSIGAQITYGKELSLMVATRQPQYHSKPHAHDSEQLNYVLEGELYVFIDDFGFLARQGDVFRVPRGSVHWSWVQGKTECVLLETHCPPLTGDPGVLDTAIGLLGDEEFQGRTLGIASEWPTGIDQASVEARVMGEGTHSATVSAEVHQS